MKIEVHISRTAHYRGITKECYLCHGKDESVVMFRHLDIRTIYDDDGDMEHIKMSVGRFKLCGMCAVEKNIEEKIRILHEIRNFL